MVTLKDIARMANVSVGTVSRIINQDPSLSVSPHTRRAVLEIAQELNYKKRKSASKSLTMGIFQWFSMFQELEDPYWLDIRLGIEQYCLEHQIEVVRAFYSDTNYTEALRDVDALICIGRFHKNELSIFEGLTNNVIFLDMGTERILYNTIVLDYDQAVTDALSYLKDLGHSHIGYLGGKEYLKDGTLYCEKRKDTFIRYCKQHDICYKPYLIEENFSAESGYQMTMQLIENRTVPTAIFAASDPIAMGVMRALTESGYHIPNDVSVIGFDNIASSAFSNPPLTTIDAPSHFMGEYAAHYMSLLAGGTDTRFSCPIRVTLPCSLVIRKSCAKPKKLCSE